MVPQVLQYSARAPPAGDAASPMRDAVAGVPQTGHRSGWVCARPSLVEKSMASITQAAGQSKNARKVQAGTIVKILSGKESGSSSAAKALRPPGESMAEISGVIRSFRLEAYYLA